MNAVPHKDRRQSPYQDLPFGANVEETTLKTDRHGQSGEDVRD